HLPAFLAGGFEARRAGGLGDLVSVIYAGIGAWIGWRRFRVPGSDRGQACLLLLAAGSILLATLLAASDVKWAGTEWLLPLSLFPAAVFGLAITDLLFRRHALDVRFFLRQSAQYALARGALPALLL